MKVGGEAAALLYGDGVGQGPGEEEEEDDEEEEEEKKKKGGEPAHPPTATFPASTADVICGKFSPRRPPEAGRTRGVNNAPRGHRDGGLGVCPSPPRDPSARAAPAGTGPTSLTHTPFPCALLLSYPAGLVIPYPLFPQGLTLLAWPSPAPRGPPRVSVLKHGVHAMRSCR